MNKTSPLISIIVPIYNVEQFLTRCLKSICNQSYQNIEIILVNDGSTDNSENIALEFQNKDDRIKYYYKENGGLSSARNFGIKVSHGEFIGFVDSDDWISKDMFYYLLNLIFSYNADISCINYLVTNKETDLINKNIKIYEYNNEVDIYKHIISKEDYSFCTKLFKRQLISHNMFKEGKCNEDILAWCKLIKPNMKIVYSTKIQYFYFNNTNHVSISNPIYGVRKRDFDLLYATNCLYKKTIKYHNSSLTYLSELKNARSYFSLLAKIAFYGYLDVELKNNEKKIESELLYNLKNNLIVLMKSNIGIKRKIPCLMFCCNYTISKKIFRLIKKIYRR